MYKVARKKNGEISKSDESNAAAAAATRAALYVHSNFRSSRKRRLGSFDSIRDRHECRGNGKRIRPATCALIEIALSSDRNSRVVSIHTPSLGAKD